MAKITVNDKLQEIQDTLTLKKLIALNDIEQPDMVSVQLNGEFVVREDYGSTVLNDGDVVDFLYFMGGGN
ncbi:MAG: sulfur carrier protein ThiS [Tannerella sp.]|jgi:sulfur carrier protein|nr:sulfur carrier protein ThiS [Tannerella sp.]